MWLGNCVLSRGLRPLLSASVLWGSFAFGADPAAITTQNEGAVLLILAGNDDGRVLQGSGCVVDGPKGLALTTAHQVRDMTHVRGLTADNQEYILEVAQVDRDRDLAVLRSRTPLPKAAVLGDPAALKAGGDVVSITSPKGIAFSTNIGHITNTRYARRGRTVLLTDLPLTNGSSGGPVFDMEGRLVGLVSERIDDVSNTVIVPVTDAYPMLCHLGTGLSVCDKGEGEEPAMDVPASAGKRQLEAVSAYNRGVQAGTAGEKIACYQEATSALPTFYEAWFNLGLAYGSAGDWAGAIRSYEQARDLRPGAVRVRRNLGQALLRDGQMAEGAVELEGAVRLAPDDERAHNDLGEAYRRLERFDAAAAAFEKSLVLRPEYPEAHFNLALTLVRLGRPADAIRHFEAYLQYAPAAEDAADVRQIIDELRTKETSE